ncbi:hypothetical protein GP486_007511, partial [Trichoglossum hirsutum]
MSNYPPTPSFGLNFSFAPVPSSSGARPSMSGGSRHSTGSVQRKPPAPPPITNSTQMANTYHRDANVPGYNMASTYRAPPAAPSYGQVTGGPIPPPFSTMRTHQELLGQITPLTTGSGSDSGYALPPPKHRLAQAENAGGTANTDHLMVQPDKEEGELSDRDVERKSSPGQEVAIAVPQPTRSGTIDGNQATDAGSIWNQKGQKGKSLVARDTKKNINLNKAPTSSARVPSGPRAYDGHPSNRHVNPPKGNAYSPLENWRHDQYIPERRDTAQNYPQQSISPLSNVRERKKAMVYTPSTFSHSHIAFHQGHDSEQATPSPGRCSPTAGKPYLEIRKLAKNALLNLIPLKVEYKDFINEGINEEVVKSLYEELRLRVPAATAAQQTEESPPKQVPSPQTPQLPEPIKSPGPPGHGRITTHSEGLTVPHAIHVTQTPITSDTSSQHHASIENSGARGPADKGIPPTPPAGKASSVSVTTETGTQSVNGTSVEPKLSRAELIKQRFAERENKKAKIITPVGDGKTHSSSDSVPDREKDLAAEKEKKVKNELIKQRMEMLKKSTSLKSSGPPPTDAEKDTSQSHISINGSAPPQETQLIKQQDPTSTVATNVPFTGIPGLFMTYSSAPGNDASSNSIQDPAPPPQTQGPNRRKRPVAADFEDTPTPTAGSFKRPFGRSRVDRPLVIEVSDDDSANGDDDTDMDIDDDDGPDSDRQQKPTQPSQGRSAIRDYPPLSDFSNKRKPGVWGSAPVSAMSTPPLSKDSPFSYPNGRGKSSAQEDLKRKYEQIELMQRKIAELEQKKSKPVSSRGQTPGTPGRSAHSTKKDQNPKVPEKSDAQLLQAATAAAAVTAAEIDRLIEDANRQVDADKLKLAESDAVDLERTKQDEKAEADSAFQKQLRLAEIESGIPLIDAEVEKSRNRLEELRAETAKWEAAIREGLEGKRKLMEEMEQLKIKESRATDEAEIQVEKNEVVEGGESPQQD